MSRTVGRGARWGARVALALFWLLHWLPLPVLAAAGWLLGTLAWPLARSRRRIALINLRQCFPQWSEAQRRALARDHLRWLVRSLLERSLLLFASSARLQRLIRVEGDLQRAERTGQPTMWLLPHFVALEFIGPVALLGQRRPVVDVYQAQPNPVFDAALLRARSRHNPTQAILVERAEGVRPVLRAMQKDGAIFCNAPDMDFGRKDSAFVPFFGVPACTLVSPARMARSMGLQVQTVVMEILPWGRGYVARLGEAPEGFDDPDPSAAAAAWNRWLEARILERPGQYLWVHRRFKNRPDGLPRLY
ncbi:lysophospholipid acyltransferase family protein [Ideonella livida]|uniref:Lipid A biosynthesis acyltransferase n=1 Tax=Ideonella livida TaxID=2707176 RepID=A0A7C9TLT2_9BURK|nr:lipid A biosynthesis acyltransferase [Ideonella livida]NDY92704.1 lipid A biosynthesis acyltransferase [Ideonella livida]